MFKHSPGGLNPEHNDAVRAARQRQIGKAIHVGAQSRIEQVKAWTEDPAVKAALRSLMNQLLNRRNIEEFTAKRGQIYRKYADKAMRDKLVAVMRYEFDKLMKERDTIAT